MKKKHSWSNVQKAEFLQRVGSLIEQGFTISECIELFMNYEKEQFKPILVKILEELKGGSSFSMALSPLQLPKDINSFVYFAEHYGNLAKGLIDGGSLLNKKEDNKKKLKKILKYPLFLLWFLIIFLIILYQYLFPQFLLLFSSLSIELPLITRLLLGIMKNAHLFLILLLVLFCCFIGYYFVIFRKKDELHKAETLSLYPIFGYYYRIMLTYYFATNLSFLIRSGMSIFEALVLFREQTNLGYIRLQSNKIISNLEQGESLQKVLVEDTIYLEQLAYIVEHGQKNGRLDEELEHYSQWLLKELEQNFKKLYRFIQPILFLLIGIMILLTFAAIMIPIFALINGV